MEVQQSTNDKQKEGTKRTPRKTEAERLSLGPKINGLFPERTKTIMVYLPRWIVQYTDGSEEVMREEDIKGKFNATYLESAKVRCDGMMTKENQPEAKRLCIHSNWSRHEKVTIVCNVGSTIGRKTKSMNLFLNCSIHNKMRTSVCMQVVQVPYIIVD